MQFNTTPKSQMRIEQLTHKEWVLCFYGNMSHLLAILSIIHKAIWKGQTVIAKKANKLFKQPCNVIKLRVLPERLCSLFISNSYQLVDNQSDSVAIGVNILLLVLSFVHYVFVLVQCARTDQCIWISKHWRDLETRPTKIRQ